MKKSLGQWRNLFRRNFLLLFSLMLMPLAMHANPTFQANGYGNFTCAQAYPREGFGDGLTVNISGSDGQGNYMTTQMNVGQLGGLPTCTATLPTILFDANVSGYSGGGGEVNYDGLTYNAFGDCSSPASNIRCDITFTSGDNGSIDIALKTWTLTFDSQGDIIYETPPTTVDIGGTVNFNSLEAGEQLGFGNVLYPASSGTFTLGDGTFTTFVPEPASFGLVGLAFLPVCWMLRRRSRSTTRSLA